MTGKTKLDEMLAELEARLLGHAHLPRCPMVATRKSMCVCPHGDEMRSERHRASRLRYLSSHPGAAVASSRKYRSSHRADVLARRRALRKENPNASNRASLLWRTKNPKRVVAMRLRSQAKYPEKRKARLILANAVHRGNVVKPDACSACGECATVHGHHTDYSRPLDVVWLCAFCHSAQHSHSRFDALTADEPKETQ